MKKNKGLLFLSLGLIILVAIGYTGCGPDNKCPQCEEEKCKCPDPKWLTKVTEENDQQPGVVNVLIDKSKSMEGYFEQSSVHNILVTINDLVGCGERKGTVSLMGDAPMGNYATGLMNASNFGKDTDMKQIISDLIKCGKNTVNAFVTDGIVSSTNGENDLPQMMSDIENILKSKKNFGYAIYRFKAPYKGTYYIESTRTNGYKTANLNGVERPYFVILVGNKDQVRYICNNSPFKGDDYQMLSFNTHDDYSKLYFFPTNDKKVFSGPDNSKRTYFLLDDSPENLSISFRYPKGMEGRLKELNAKNASLTLNDKEIEGWKIKVADGQANIDIPNPGSVLDKADSSDNQLQLKFLWNDSKKWTDKYSSDNDGSIENSTSEQKKTYGLKHLIEAFDDAGKNNEVVVTLNFEKV